MNKRLEFKILDTPAPSSYSGPVVHDFGVGTANKVGLMTMAPATRTFDTVLNNAVRNVCG